jgi:superfamily II DNA or RNA helicase
LRIADSRAGPRGVSSRLPRFARVPAPLRPLRSHQRRIAGIVSAIVSGEAGGLRDVLAAVTPGGGKSVLPLIAASRLIEAGIADRVCWIVPRDSLRLQAEEAFADPNWRAALGHACPCARRRTRPTLAGASRATSPPTKRWRRRRTCTLAEFKRRRYLLVIDEVHHLPALADADPSGFGPMGAGGADVEASWSKAILPLLELAQVRLLLSGTLERADGRGILWLPYREGPRTRTREVDLDAPGWAVVGYSRAAALAEKAVLPITFGALDGEARWLDEGRRPVGPHRLSGDYETTRQALFTALRTEFADALLDEALAATRRLRAERRVKLALAPGEPGRGLGKLLVVAPDQENARRYLARVHGRMPARGREAEARLAVSDAGDAHEALAAFRLQAQPSVLVTVAMAYEGLDAPETAVVAALTHIRSRPWLEQMVARATRVDPFAGAWEEQRALVYHPDDLCSAASASGWRRSRAPSPGHTKGAGSRPALPRRGRARRRGGGPHRAAALQRAGAALRDAGARPRLRGAAAGGAGRPARSAFRAGAAAAPPHRRAGGDAGGGGRGGAALPRAGGNYHRLNAVLKRVLGKGRGEMARRAGRGGLVAGAQPAGRPPRPAGRRRRYAFEARRRAGLWQPPRGRAGAAAPGRAAEAGRRGGGGRRPPACGGKR